MRNEILIAFWVTLLAMVVFGCLKEPPASDDSIQPPAEQTAGAVVTPSSSEAGINPEVNEIENTETS